jgi:hypothetical protein
MDEVLFPTAAGRCVGWMFCVQTVKPLQGGLYNFSIDVYDWDRRRKGTNLLYYTVYTCNLEHVIQRWAVYRGSLDWLTCFFAHWAAWHAGCPTCPHVSVAFVGSAEGCCGVQPRRIVPERCKLRKTAFMLILCQAFAASFAAFLPSLGCSHDT